MFKTTIATATMAALALPAGAAADKPERPGKPRHEHAAKAAATVKAQRVAFVVTGTGLSGLTLSDAGSSAFALDIARANKHARAALQLTAAQIAAASATQMAAEANGLRLKFDDDITDGNGDGKVDLADVRPTDRVKVIGKVERTRTRDASRARRFTYGTIDVRKVVIKRDDDQSA